MNHNLLDINFRFVSTKLELSDEEGTVQTTVVVKQLQVQKLFIDLNTGIEIVDDWKPVPEFTDDDVLAEEELEQPEVEDELTEEEAVDRIEGAIQQEKTS